MEINFLTTFDSQIEILPRLSINYGKEVNEMGWDCMVEINWLWFCLLIVKNSI
jgi:hypothetical protein